MQIEGRRTVGEAASRLAPLLLPLLALLPPHPWRAQFAPPPAVASTPEAPNPRSAERDVSRRDAVGERGDAVLRPNDIGRLRDQMLDAQGATSYPNYIGRALPTPKRRNIAYAPHPDRPPEALSLWRGMATSLTFLDEAGKPVPIEAVIYDKKLFAMNGMGCVEDSGTQAQGAASDERQPQPSTFFMVPCAHWAWGSFAVQLRGHPIPVTFMATSGVESVGHVVDVPVVLTVSKPPGVPTAVPAARRPLVAAVPATRPIAADPAARIARRTGGQEGQP